MGKIEKAWTVFYKYIFTKRGNTIKKCVNTKIKYIEKLGQIQKKLCDTVLSTKCSLNSSCNTRTTNISARINLSTNRVMSGLMMIHYLAILARIMLGYFPIPVVVTLHYVNRVNRVSFLTMLAFNSVLKTLFILDFQGMTAVPEKTNLISMGVFTFLCT